MPKNNIPLGPIAFFQPFGVSEGAVMVEYGSFYVVGYVVVADRLSVAKYT